MLKSANLVFFAIFTVTACGNSGDDSNSGADAAPGGGDRGSATLTIGDDIWEFDNFSCYVGTDETQSNVYSFNSNSIQTFDGTRVQMQAEIRDDSEQGRLEGDDLIFVVYINDIEDFENPAINFESTNEENEALVEAGLAPPSGNTQVTLDGDSVSASGEFDDKLTEDDFTLFAGTLEGTCAP